MERVWLAIGSNLSDPLQQVCNALKKLKKLSQTNVVSCSSYYRSRPYGPQDQPDFLNAVVALDTNLTPEILLNYIQRIELYHGRVRQTRWGPRTLDLDILLFGQKIINTTRLQIPHCEMLNREFVLYPLAELEPDLHFPIGGSLADSLRLVPHNGLNYWDEVHRYKK